LQAPDQLLRRDLISFGAGQQESGETVVGGHIGQSGTTRRDVPIAGIGVLSGRRAAPGTPCSNGRKCAMAQVVQPCEEWLDDVSGWLDGEVTMRDSADVARHVDGCSGCARFVESSQRAKHQSLQAMNSPRLRLAAPGGDPPRRALRLSPVAAVERELRSPVVLRGLLALVAAQVLILSLISIFQSGSSGTIHDARHLGSFGVAYAVGLFTVVHRPARARAMLPVAFVLVGSLAITAVVDVVERRVPLIAEGAHLPELISVALVWALARSNARP
jgi:predicted anti-sigma-YlaC factor YlaD